MIIFLYGEDSYRSREKLKEIIENYQKVHKAGLSLKRFDGEDFELEEFRNEFQTNSIFNEKKLIILKNIFGQKEEAKILEILKKNKKSDNIILLYEEKEIKKTSPLFVFLKKEGKYQEFDSLTGLKLENWLKKEISSQKLTITKEALGRLIDSIGNDSWQYVNEIKKLASWCLSNKSKTNPKIEAKDVELLVKPKIETDIFRTIDAIAQKNKKLAFSLLHHHLEKGDNPLYLLSMINFQFRNLLIIKDLIERREPYYSFGKISNLHPFLVRKSYQQAFKFSLPELKKIYQKIFQADLDIKTGRVKPEVALDLLIAEI